MRIAILPTPHTPLPQCLLGLGGYILELLETPRTVDALYAALKAHTDRGLYPARHSFENVILAVNLLHCVGAIEAGPNGEIRKCA
jgi:hypothetical protein